MMLRVAFVFGLVFLVSALWYLPASWVYQQLEIEKKLPPNVKQTVRLSNVSGVWWQGQITLQFKQNGWVDAGELRWRWLPSQLFVGQLGAAIDWQISENHQVSMRLASDGNLVKMSAIEGGGKIANLAKFHAIAAGLLDDAKGEVIFDQVNVTIDLASPQLPKEVSGVIALNGFEAMGVSIQNVNLAPSVDQNILVVNVEGGSPGWRLFGNTKLMNANRFQHDLSLRADAPNKMPDWVSLMMRQQSETLAELKVNGRF